MAKKKRHRIKGTVEYSGARKYSDRDVKNVIQPTFQQLRKRRIPVNPDTLVKEVTPRNHPMHPFFIWNNKIAGHLHRLETARQIIMDVRVDFDHRKMRGWVPELETVGASIRGTGSYIPSTEALTSKKQRQLHIRRALFDLQLWQKRYQLYVDAVTSMKHITKVLRDLERALVRKA